MTLRWRVALVVAGLVATAMVAGSIGARIAAERELVGEIDTFLTDRTEQLAPILGDRRALRALADERPGARLGGDRGDGVGRILTAPDAVTQIQTPDGTVVATIEGQPLLPTDDVGRAGATFRDAVVDGVAFRQVTRTLPNGVSLIVARDRTEVDAALAGLIRQLFVVGLLVTTLAAAIGWFIARRLTAPIERLTGAADTIATTQTLDASIEPGGGGEVGRLTDSFNTMVAALRQSKDQQQRLVADAGHELRTPLTSLRTNVELLQTTDLSDPDRNRVLSGISSELNELTNLVTELVDLGTDSATTEVAVPCDLLDLAEQVVDRARRRHGRDISVAGSASPVLAQPGLMDRAISNIVDNAVKYSDATPIVVTVAAGAVSVRDFGAGIPADDLPYVFERFHRSAQARAVPGSGLGLSIVEQIVAANGGSVFARNADPAAGDDAGSGAVVGFSLNPPPD